MSKGKASSAALVFSSQNVNLFCPALWSLRWRSATLETLNQNTTPAAVSTRRWEVLESKVVKSCAVLTVVHSQGPVPTLWEITALERTFPVSQGASKVKGQQPSSSLASFLRPKEADLRVSAWMRWNAWHTGLSHSSRNTLFVAQGRGKGK